MIGIVVAAHGPLPEALIESAEMILGDTEGVTALALMPDDNLEGLIERTREAAKEVNSGEGALILLDLFGGTPSNAAALITQEEEGVHAVSGVNVPMLLETLLARRSAKDLLELSRTAVESGTKGIVDIVEAFQRYQQRKAEGE
jgi:mannose/fructose/sorbose-specific phosphotransferase system IIA component